MIRELNEKARSLRNALGLGVALVTIGTLGGMLYMLERDGDAFAIEIQALKEEDKRILRDIHAKNLACNDLKHAVTIASRQHSHTVGCK